MANPIMTMMSNNNPFLMMMEMMRSGKNPQALVDQMISQNPQMGAIWQQAQNMAKQNPQESARQLCQQKGLNFNEMADKFGLKQV